MKTELYQEYRKHKAMLTLGFVHPNYEEWLEKQVASLRSEVGCTGCRYNNYVRGGDSYGPSPCYNCRRISDDKWTPADRTEGEDDG